MESFWSIMYRTFTVDDLFYFDGLISSFGGWNDYESEPYDWENDDDFV